jgi:hypothetical protein
MTSTAFHQETVMSRRLVQLAFAASAAAALGSPAAADDRGAYTTRIEPRPFYGATVTIESGVRVFRPLPSQRHVIINPGGQTPLHLGYQDTRVYEESRSYNYHRYDDAPNYGGGYGLGGFGGHKFRDKPMRKYGPLIGKRHY